MSAPFHCSLMMPAAKDMSKKINETEFKKPLIEIINNVFADIENDPKVIKKNLIEQIHSTVKWRESIEYMKKKGNKKLCRNWTRKSFDWNGKKNNQRC